MSERRSPEIPDDYKGKLIKAAPNGCLIKILPVMERMLDIFPNTPSSFGSAIIYQIYVDNEDDLNKEYILCGEENGPNHMGSLARVGKYQIGQRVEIIQITQNAEIIGRPDVSFDRYYIRPFDPENLGKQIWRSRDFAYPINAENTSTPI